MLEQLEYFLASPMKLYAHYKLNFVSILVNRGIRYALFQVRGFLSNLNGAVLESFGAGNIPHDIVPALREATTRQVLIVNVTQCLEGTVDDSIYATGEVSHRGFIKSKSTRFGIPEA